LHISYLHLHLAYFSAKAGGHGVSAANQRPSGGGVKIPHSCIKLGIHWTNFGGPINFSLLIFNYSEQHCSKRYLVIVHSMPITSCNPIKSCILTSSLRTSVFYTIFLCYRVVTTYY
jgi:hypothetical protein